jgi:N-acetylmuramic acid 6-phosphate etherase
MTTNSGRGYLITEQSLPLSQDLDQLSIEEFIDLCQQEDEKTLLAVGTQTQQICQGILMISEAIRAGGRLFYVGAGTSGRLGVLDAAECPPTFSVPPELIQGIIAGGKEALVRSAEGAEDSAADGGQAIINHQITDRDVVMGITAGGTTPFVHGALQQASLLGAKTIFFACVPAEQVPTNYDLEIRPVVGAEILTGSTRLKAGTATKLVLNRISTGVMIQLGKVYRNHMVDVAVTNTKLQDRAIRILTDILPIDRLSAWELLQRSGLNVKTAVVMYHYQTDRQSAERILKENDGHLRRSLI